MSNVFGKRKAISSTQFRWSCWSVNVPKSSQEQDRANNVTLNTDGIQAQFPNNSEILHSAVNEAFFLNLESHKLVAGRSNVRLILYVVSQLARQAEFGNLHWEVFFVLERLKETKHHPSNSFHTEYLSYYSRMNTITACREIQSLTCCAHLQLLIGQSLPGERFRAVTHNQGYFGSYQELMKILWCSSTNLKTFKLKT